MCHVLDVICRFVANDEISSNESVLVVLLSVNFLGVAEYCRIVFARFGQLPSSMETSAAMTTSTMDDIGRPVASPETIYSCRHEAIAACVNRILRPVWGRKLSNILYPFVSELWLDHCLDCPTTT